MEQWRTNWTWNTRRTLGLNTSSGRVNGSLVNTVCMPVLVRPDKSDAKIIISRKGMM